jgi:acetyl esterase/lipase
MDKHGEKEETMVKFDKSGCKIRKIRIERKDGSRMKLLIVSPEHQSGLTAGVLWLHGGGYLTGFPEMVFMSRAIDLVRECGAVVVSPSYRLSFQKPFPAALEDSYLALCWIKEHARELGIHRNQIMVGGESAGGGLAAALCLYARDKGEVNIAFQMPLYPMLDCEDTDSSRSNRNKVWNTRKNHFAWNLYLRSLKGKGEKIPQYASPAREENYSNLPPAYTFVWKDEPFYQETLDYVRNLEKAGIPAYADVYPGGYHALDMMEPDSKAAKLAKERFITVFEHAKKYCFSRQPEN